MKVAELIAHLEEMPADADVLFNVDVHVGPRDNGHAVRMLANPAVAAGVIRHLMLRLSGTLPHGRRAVSIMKG